MRILGVESSATAASAAVTENGIVKSLQFSNTGLTHSQTLMPMIDNALKSAAININDIDYIAVSNGPGSFTGVRIGVAAVKGLAQPLNIKCVGISSLEAIAKPLEGTGVLAVSVMDARCKQFYTASFDCSNGFERVTPDEALSFDELKERLLGTEKRIILIGDGANLCFDMIKEYIPSVGIASPVFKYQSAASVAILAEQKITDNPGIAVSAASLLPEYLRVSQAERELSLKKEK